MKKIIKRIKQIICRHTDCKYLYVDKSRRKVFYECKKCVKTISVHWMGPGAVVDTNSDTWTIV